MKNIVNIINFARGVEPRDPNVDLWGTLETELKLCREYGFVNTVLLQYDALIQPEYPKLVKQYQDLSQPGLWMEVVEPLAQVAGIPWRGRWPWDWHSDVGFLIGYEPQERKRLIDAAFSKFREIFGHYPSTVGSWHIDAVSLDYMRQQYGVVASCNCKDQYGTDGYTMWGGYYNGAYYPSKKNMFCPAQTLENQISLPVFRMLGSDPIHQYDFGLGQQGNYDPSNCQGVATLEPIYDNAGADPQWVDWYFKENFNGKSLCFAYTQAGQENSFGWPDISKGLPMQFEKLKRMQELGEVEIETLEQSGRWFAGHYQTTPAAAMCIDSDYSPAQNKTVWYYNRLYRTNLLFEANKLWIRDLYLFDEQFEEKYLDEKETQNLCGFYNLPVMDGFRFSRGAVRAGIYPVVNGKDFTSPAAYWSRTEGNDTVAAGLGEDLVYRMEEHRLTVRCRAEGWRLVWKLPQQTADALPYQSVTPKELFLSFAGYTRKQHRYSLKLEQGVFEAAGPHGSNISVRPENGAVVFRLG